jgi:hypothetical protein
VQQQVPKAHWHQMLQSSTLRLLKLQLSLRGMRLLLLLMTLKLIKML